LGRVEKSNFTVVYNPFSKVINLRFNDGIIPTGALLQLYSMTGSLLARLPITDSTTVLKTDKLVSGIYAVCISENGKVQTRKIIIIH
jgi:hypothetical protein